MHFHFLSSLIYHFSNFLFGNCAAFYNLFFYSSYQLFCLFLVPYTFRHLSGNYQLISGCVCVFGIHLFACHVFIGFNGSHQSRSTGNIKGSCHLDVSVLDAGCGQSILIHSRRTIGNVAGGNSDSAAFLLPFHQYRRQSPGAYNALRQIGIQVIMFLRICHCSYGIIFQIIFRNPQKLQNRGPLLLVQIRPQRYIGHIRLGLGAVRKGSHRGKYRQNPC